MDQMVKKKKSVCNAGDPGLTPQLERSFGEENGYPLQYLAWTEEALRATVHGVTKSWT